MADELATTLDLLSGLDPARETFRYADDKWSIREVVGYLIDTEWTFGYRGLCFARTFDTITGARGLDEASTQCNSRGETRCHR